MTRPLRCFAYVLSVWCCGIALASAPGGPAITIVVPHRRVLPREPLYARLELRNTGDVALGVVPPYHSYYRPGAAAIDEYTITCEDGTREGNGWAGHSNQYVPVEFGRSFAGDPLGRRPWVIAAGASVSAWLEPLDAWPPLRPGRYHVVARYRATEAMAAGIDGAVAGLPPDLGIWEGTADLDFGWIEVAEPDGTDADALAWWCSADKPGAPPWGFPNDWIAQRRREFIERFPNSVYAASAEYYHLLWLSSRYPTHLTPVRAETEKLAKDAGEVTAEFVERHPDFPLMDLVPIVGPVARFSVQRYATRDDVRSAATEPLRAADAIGDQRLADWVRSIVRHRERELEDPSALP